MSNIVERREYRDGDNFLIANILDNGCVSFTTAPEGSYAGVSAEVLEELAELARKADSGG